MINGLYSGASALDIFSRQQELVASNLAHLNSPGHRRLLFTFQQQNDSSGDQATARPGTDVDKFVSDFSQGRLQPTGRALDIAISGDAFLVYEGANENIYSRNGALFRNPAGELVNSDGLRLLSEGQPVVIPPDVSDRNLVIDESGNISANGSQIANIALVSFNDNQLLESNNQTYFRAGEAIVGPADDFKLVQGTRELSNATPVSQLITLIVGSRNHESAQRAIRTISESMQQSTRE